MDFSTTITIRNQTGRVLGLLESTPVQGYFEAGLPPNMIEDGEAQDITIRNTFGLYGSHGTCVYEVHDPASDGSESEPAFSLDFGDPTGFGSNWLTAKPDSDVVEFEIHPYNSKGHPFHAFIDVRLKGNGIVPNSVISVADKMATSTREGNHAKKKSKPGLPGKSIPIHAYYHIGFHAPLDIVDHKPIHETIAIAALIRSKLYTPKGTTYDNLNLKQWEYIRGIIWNDDPSCLLFDDDLSNNHGFSWGLKWFEAYETGDPRCMTKRSHFGDLQFLHGMATVSGEAAETTRDNLLVWMEVMYKLACGNQGISEQDTLESVFKGRYFDHNSEPSLQSSLKDLLLATTTKYIGTNLNHRALGICMHTIADSFAVGHTQRVWLNPQDLDPAAPSGEILFKDGTCGRCGDILAFHCYAGQDDKKHMHYDMLIGAMPTPKDIDSFNHILGARDAIQYSTKLIDFWYEKTEWKNGVEQFLRDQVFRLDANVQRGNTDV